VGLRFGPIPVPQGTTIAAAHIQFTVDETTTEATTLTLRGQASDNAPTFTTATGNITARPLTTASALWTPPPWPTLGAAGTEQESPDLAAVINEIVNRPGWVSGQSLAIIISGTGRRVAQSWNLAPSGAPVLHVEYGGSIPVDVGNGPAPGLALERVRPTPSRGVLGVDLSLPDARPARLELIDIAGRRVATRELAGRGPGRHHVELARGLRAGVYLVRLVQGDLARTLKAVVLD
jgi:hypothetical protein